MFKSRLLFIRSYIKDFQHISRCYLHTKKKNVCVIGSGPAGFYTAQHILKNNSTAHVDIFEKLPVPFGLVRYGVAPDHQDVKNATSQFEEIAKNERCKFFGNVNIGVDLKFKELHELYDAVVFAYGADDDKKLNIPGEDLNGVLSARSFVGWYNGLPAHADLSPNLNCKTAVIFGQGNVSLDVARMLLAPIDMLKHTDICQHALQALAKSKIEKVYIIGRRGPLQVSFTIKELREQIKLPNTKAIFPKDIFLKLKDQIKDLPRPRKRLVDLMYKTAIEPVASSSEIQKTWELQFFRSPVEILDNGNSSVKGVKMQVNKLVEDESGQEKAVGTDTFEELNCGLVLRSIGYKSIKVDDGVPFDIRMGVIPNINGRVVQEAGSNEIVKGLYCSGWVKHGPVGVIATTMNESYATAQSIVADFKNGVIGNDSADHPILDIEKVLQNKDIDYVTFEDYLNIDNFEISRGKESSKIREKITAVKEMMNIAFKSWEEKK